MKRESTVLIAEPEESIALEIFPYLKERDTIPFSVKSLKEVLLTLQGRRVHVLVLDADLLNEDCEFISIIKGIEKDLPIIVCARTNTPQFETRIRHQPVFYYHIRSFGPQDLEMAIANALNKVSK